MASRRVANAFSTKLKLIWLKSSLKTTQMSKNAILAKSSMCQWVNHAAETGPRVSKAG